MSLTINLPADAEARLAEQATSIGVDVPTYVERILRAAASRTSLDQVLKPIRRSFRESGMTEDELSEILVKAKKEMRADRRTRRDK
jgi:hypothetical protein